MRSRSSARLASDRKPISPGRGPMFLRMVAACLVLVWPAAASAHQGTGPHGGPVSDAGPYYVELIAQENELRVFIFDDKTDGPVQTEKASATATVLSGEEKQTVALRPGP